MSRIASSPVFVSFHSSIDVRVNQIHLRGYAGLSNAECHLKLSPHRISRREQHETGSYKCIKCKKKLRVQNGVS